MDRCARLRHRRAGREGIVKNSLTSSGQDRSGTTGQDDSGIPDEQLGGGLFAGRARSADYQAWADRLKQKRLRAQERIAADSAVADGRSTDEPSTYWSTDALFTDSARFDEDERSTPDLAVMLGVRGEVTLETVNEAYRQLAKLHHPDRFVDAEAEERDHHETEMIRLNKIYTTLKSRLSVE